MKKEEKSEKCSRRGGKKKEERIITRERLDVVLYKLKDMWPKIDPRPRGPKNNALKMLTPSRGLFYHYQLF